VVLDSVERIDLRSERPPPADVVAANLMRPLLLRIAESLEALPPRLIVSGLLADEAAEVAAAFAPLTVRERFDDAGWCALLLAG
jgi:ribosomal protein L11 methylase PrmA